MDMIMVVIPVHNEAPTIASVVLTARAYLPVIVVTMPPRMGVGRELPPPGPASSPSPGTVGRGQRCNVALPKRSGVGPVLW